MADPKSSNSPSVKNVLEKAKGDFEAVLHNGKHKHHQHHKETHGLRDDININTPSSDVKAPNVFERAKEEIEAIVEAIHSKKESKSHDSQLHGEASNNAGKDGMKSEKSELHSDDKFLHNGKHKHHQHHKETHGLRDDIDVNTPATDAKAPNVFERAKEEIEAIVEAIHSKKESKSHDSQLHGEASNDAGKDGMKSEKSELHSDDKFLHNGKHKHHQHHKETHGLRDDIDFNTPATDVKAPNVFERAKEEIEAIVEAIHSKKESKSHDSQLHGEASNDAGKDGMKSEKSELHSEKKGKTAPNLMPHIPHHHHHHKESHGTRNDIDENTPTTEVKAPNMFGRAKEEIEAIIDTIHHKK